MNERDKLREKIMNQLSSLTQNCIYRVNDVCQNPKLIKLFDGDKNMLQCDIPRIKCIYQEEPNPLTLAAKRYK